MALSLVILALPLGLVISIGIIISSPGPVFYLGQRTGLNGRSFRIIKFRTMVADAERKGEARPLWEMREYYHLADCCDGTSWMNYPNSSTSCVVI